MLGSVSAALGCTAKALDCDKAAALESIVNVLDGDDAIALDFAATSPRCEASALG